MNIKLKRNDLKKKFKLMNNAISGKSIEKVMNHRNDKLITTDSKRNCLVSEPNYYTTKIFSETVLTAEMKNTQILINKPDF